MTIAPPTIVHEPPDLMPAVRELLCRYPEVADSQPTAIARLLWESRTSPHIPNEWAVETALEALRVEGEVLA